MATKHNIPFLIIANGDEDTILHTQYRKNVALIRDYNRMDIIYIKEIIQRINIDYKYKQVYIVPNSEYIIRFIFENKASLQEIGVNIDYLGEQSLYEMLSDKISFYNLCRTHGMCVPLNFEDEKLKYPIVIKPKRYFDSNNKVYYPQMINNKKELDAFLNGKKEEDFFLQEYIEGKSYYLLFYIGENTEVVYSQKNILQQPYGKSMIYCKPHRFEIKIYQPFISMFREIGYKGMIMIELIKKDGQYYCIEANPRLWGPIQLTLDNRVPIIENFIKECGFYIETFTEEVLYKNVYYWNGGYVEALDKYGYIIDHDVNEEKNINELIKVEVYNREDTRLIFEEERR